MVDRGTYLVPTLSALGNILGPHRAKVPDYVLEKAERTAEAHRRSIMLFQRAGGRIAMGTDAGTPFNYHGENAQELRHMVQVGLTPMEAIIAATANAADLMHLSDTGRIREGAIADLLLARGDALDDIDAVADPANHLCVLRAGKVMHAREPGGVPALASAAE